MKWLKSLFNRGSKETAIEKPKIKCQAVKSMTNPGRIHYPNPTYYDRFIMRNHLPCNNDATQVKGFSEYALSLCDECFRSS